MLSYDRATNLFVQRLAFRSRMTLKTLAACDRFSGPSQYQIIARIAWTFSYSPVLKCQHRPWSSIFPKPPVTRWNFSTNRFSLFATSSRAWVCR